MGQRRAVIPLERSMWQLRSSAWRGMDATPGALGAAMKCHELARGDLGSHHEPDVPCRSSVTHVELPTARFRE